MRISDWSSDVCSSDLNRVRVVDEEQEDVAIGRIERRRVAADVDIGIIVHVRPVEHAWNLPPGLPDAISGDLHHRSDEFVIEDPAIVGTGGSAQFGPSIVGLRSEEHTSELQSLMRISYAVFCLKKKN